MPRLLSFGINDGVEVHVISTMSIVSNFYCLNIIWYKVSVHKPCKFYSINNIWYNDTVDTQRDDLVNKSTIDWHELALGHNCLDNSI